MRPMGRLGDSHSVRTPLGTHPSLILSRFIPTTASRKAFGCFFGCGWRVRAPAATKDGWFHSSERGLLHCKLGKRAKSLSHEQSVAPWEIASAARCASVVRLPPVPVAMSSRRICVQCSSVSRTRRTVGWASQRSIRPQACSTLRGLGKTETRVLKRRNPPITIHARPTGSTPPSADSHHARTFS